MNTQANTFDLYYHELSKNYRVLVNGNVHPLLCGLLSVELATVATQGLFPEEFTGFSNGAQDGTGYVHEVTALTKPEIISELESLIRYVKGLPADKIDHVNLEMLIVFKSKESEPLSPEIQSLVDEQRPRMFNADAAMLTNAAKTVEEFTSKEKSGTSETYGETSVLSGARHEHFHNSPNVDKQ